MKNDLAQQRTAVQRETPNNLQDPRKADTCNRIKGKIVAIIETWINGTMITIIGVVEDHLTSSTDHTELRQSVMREWYDKQMMD